MKADELEKHITFSTLPVGRSKMLVASFKWHRSLPIDETLVKSNPDWEIHARRHLCESLLRDIYEDQRDDLYEAMFDLFKANPLDLGELFEARERLLKAAMRQQPKKETE